MGSIGGPSPAIVEPASWISMLSATKDTPARHTCTGTCELCGNQTDKITMHHLYPRAVVRKAAKRGFPFTPDQKDSIASMCWPCHCIVHRLIPADILASAFHSIDLLKTHDGIRAWLVWAQPKGPQYLHSLMVPNPPKPPMAPKPPKPQMSPKASSAPNAPIAPKAPKCPTSTKATKAKGGGLILPTSSMVLSALDTIWVQNGSDFPRLEGKGEKTRGHALRQKIRGFEGLSAVKKPEIETAMMVKPEYHEWQQWVFGEGQRRCKREP
ncbi:HNH endonuclease [Mycena venus]|uniref:HNH endonuclease n=1 Tax=Mycena venus TaxID=2733690 RepID=A0A8H7CVA9_9AGAR|nr:HNH endonuclease [Mycena venus]